MIYVLLRRFIKKKKRIWTIQILERATVLIKCRRRRYSLCLCLYKKGGYNNENVSL